MYIIINILFAYMREYNSVRYLLHGYIYRPIYGNINDLTWIDRPNRRHYCKIRKIWAKYMNF